MNTNTGIDARVAAEVADGLSRRAGLRFNPNQQAALSNAVRQRLRALHLADGSAYLPRLRQNEAEWASLAEEVVVHETSFFRHAGQFRALSAHILPELVRLRRPERRLRLWSAACATGEEPYSLAIAALELGLPPDWTVDIQATDLSGRALQAAQAAVFDRRRVRSLAPDLVARYFEPDNERVLVRPEVRRLVSFNQFNLAAPGPVPEHLRGMDIVYCENVLIYFLPDVVRQAVGLLRGSLREGGYLFLGYAETLYGMSEGFSPVSFGDAYVYRRQAAPSAEAAPMRVRPSRPARPPQTRRSEPPTARQAAPMPPQPTARLVPDKATPLASPSPQAVIEARIASGDYAGAADLAGQWLLDEPDSAPARFILARLYGAQDQDAEAADLLRQGLTHNALHAPSYVLLGLLCYRQGELEEALAQLHHALYLEPDTPLAYFYLGNIHQQRGQAAQAAHAYRNAIRTAQNFVPSWDSGFTPEVLLRVCERTLARLEKH